MKSEAGGSHLAHGSTAGNPSEAGMKPGESTPDKDSPQIRLAPLPRRRISGIHDY